MFEALRTPVNDEQFARVPWFRTGLSDAPFGEVEIEIV
jgi:hypothetical protein